MQPRLKGPDNLYSSLHSRQSLLVSKAFTLTLNLQLESERASGIVLAYVE